MDKKILVNSFFWNALGKYSSQIIAFIVSVVMARILMPSDYGVMGIIAVFIAISDIFIDCGFANALINKKQCTQSDYSTVFFCNILISIGIFILLYISAPYIADFYKMEILVPTIRVMGLSFIITSIGAVSRTILIKNLKFKESAIITIISAICSGCIGICLALYGYGVWALIFQSLLTNIITIILQFINVKWIPSFIFSHKSFHELFSFGGKILGSNIIWQLHSKMYSIVIGKFFTPADLAYFTRAEGYSVLIPGNIGGILQNILFPILSKIKDDDKELLAMDYKLVKQSSIILFPLCLLLAGAAHPIIILMLTEKWEPVVPLLQILCIGVLLDHIPSINSNIFLTKGKSGFFLKMQTITKPISLILLLGTVFVNLEAAAWSKSISMFINVGVSYYYLKKILPVSIHKTFKNLYIPLISSSCLGLGLYYFYNFVPQTWLFLFIGILLYIIVYIFIIYIYDKENVLSVLHLIRSLKNK